MKTTIDIADPVLREARTLAANQGTTLRALVEQGLRHVIAEQKHRKPFRLRLVTFGGEGLRPELRDATWDENSRSFLPKGRRLIAVDANILIYAHRTESPFHQAAAASLIELADSALWAIPWPCVHEFLAIVTNHRIYNPPTPVDTALRFVDSLVASPGLLLLAESPTHWRILRSLVTTGQTTGGRMHDARIAAICLGNGVAELWSADRDFGRFPELRVVNPLVG